MGDERHALAAMVALAVLLLAGCGGAGSPEAGAPGGRAGGSGATSPAVPTLPASGAAPSHARSPSAGAALAPRGPVDGGWRVSRVVDGDTVHVTRAGTRLKVRVLGIDTPETVAPGEPVACYGPEASAYAEQRLLGRPVTLEYDDSQGRTDRYGRTLAYVWLDGPAPGTYDGMYEIDALAAGTAREYLYDAVYAWRPEFVAAEAGARAAGRGLWSACPPS